MQNNDLLNMNSVAFSIYKTFPRKVLACSLLYYVTDGDTMLPFTFQI